METPGDCVVEGPRYTAAKKGKGKRKSTDRASAVDTEELSRRESFPPSPLTGFERDQAEVDDEFIRSSPYPPPANQRFAAYCVFNGRLTGVFRTWDSTLYQVNGFKSNSYKGYPTLEDAIRAWEHAVAKWTVGPIEEHGRVPDLPRVQRRSPVVVPTPPAVSQTIGHPPGDPAPSLPRSVIGHSSRKSAHQTVPLSPRSSISLRRLTGAPVASGSGLPLGSGAFSSNTSHPIAVLPIPLAPRISSSSDLSVSSLLSSLSSGGGTASSLAYSNLPMVNDNDFYAVLVGVQPGVWQGRVNSFRRAGGLHGWRVRAATRAEAALIFADAYMADEIEKFQFDD